MGRLIDLTGKPFSRWTVIKRVSNDKWGCSRWLCKCVCGSEKEISANSLVRKMSKSCGCFHSDYMSSKRKIRYGLSTKRIIYYRYKKQAKDRNILFDLSFEQFLDLTNRNCWYCGVKPSNKRISKSNNGDFIYNGLDRKDNKKGYTLDNSVPCCIQCNRSKMDLSYEEFLDWLGKIHNNYEKIKGGNND